MAKKEQGMQPWWRMVSLLLPVLMTGYAQSTEGQAVRATMGVVERQSHVQHQPVEARVQQLSDRLTQIEHEHAVTRRDLALVTAKIEEVRGQLHRLQGAIEETKRQAQRGTAEGGAATRLTKIDCRLRALAKRLAVA